MENMIKNIVELNGGKIMHKSTENYIKICVENNIEDISLERKIEKAIEETKIYLLNNDLTCEEIEKELGCKESPRIPESELEDNGEEYKKYKTIYKDEDKIVILYNPENNEYVAEFFTRGQYVGETFPIKRWALEYILKDEYEIEL